MNAEQRERERPATSELIELRCPPGDVSIPLGFYLPDAIRWIPLGTGKQILAAESDRRSDGMEPVIGLVLTADDYDAALFLTFYHYRRRENSDVFERPLA
jgi:hypothetical protein